MTLLRRDFLKAISAFAAAAAAGGGAVAAASRPTRRAIQTDGELRYALPGTLDLELIRGCDFRMSMRLNRQVRPGYTAALLRTDGGGPAAYGVIAEAGGGLELSFPANATKRLRPGRRPWRLVWADEYTNVATVVLAGTATILPDDLWKAEEDVLAIVPQMYPLGIITKRDSYEVGFRAKLAADERSRYDDQIGTLVEHCRPVGVEVWNRGMGCRINFAPKGIL